MERSMKILISFSLLLLKSSFAFEWHAGNNRPDVTRRAIAGLWKLSTPKPLKEFTVYPKKKRSQAQDILLMLKEDGSFEQYQHESGDINDAWSQFQQRQQKKNTQLEDQLHQQLWQGTWDYHEGRLTLAADRPSKKQKQDTLLTGRVIATYETRLQDNPALQEEEAKDQSNRDEQAFETAREENSLDAHLSVPRGSVKVGRFFYPKHHPSFFEQPMYQPTKRGTVTLQQVLGSLNTAFEEDVIEEKFECADFFNKTFLLTSHPIGTYKPKRSVYDDALKKNKQEDFLPQQHNIRVLQVQFHANRTFSTLAGLGEEAILRGKFDIIGQDKDQLWMQVWRFGFGRSVSGSVYSEGRMLTHEDAKTYWGTIREEENCTAALDELTDETTTTKENKESVRLEVKGSVMTGWGIEPMPEARFIMREMTENELEDEEDDDEEGDEEDITLRNLELDIRNDEGMDSTDGIDLSDDNASFQ